MGLINARGGSKGILKKNIQLLAGKPLIYYAIKAGLESELIDRVIISTDDDEIAEIGKKYGAEVPFIRPKELAEDNVTQYPPTRHAVLELKKQGWFPDIVVLLLTNGPFKNGEDVDTVVKTLINNKVDSVRSVCEAYVSPYWMCTINKDNLIELFVKNAKMEDPNNCIRQNLPKVYQIIGIIDATWTKTIIDTNSLFGNKIKAVVFDKRKSMDIDTPFDLMMANNILEYEKDNKY